MSLDEEFYPVGYLKAARFVWAERARSSLAGGRSAVQLTSERSVVAAKQWLASRGVTKVFLTEPGLRNTFRAVGHSGKLVDLVAEGPSSRLILVEAKTILDSAGLRSVFHGVSKFESTIMALRSFYRKGQEFFPGVEELAITANEINISGRSRWAVDGDALVKGEVEIVVGGLRVMVHKIPF
jgi:hypothetical protein